jgi:Glycosyl transferases group 1
MKVGAGPISAIFQLVQPFGARRRPSDDDRDAWRDEAIGTAAGLRSTGLRFPGHAGDYIGPDRTAYAPQHLHQTAADDRLQQARRGSRASASISSRAADMPPVWAPRVRGRGRPRRNDPPHSSKPGHVPDFAFPSVIEGFGAPALGAMALGCPVVASDIDSLREVCGEATL